MKFKAAPVPRLPVPTRPARSFFPFGAALRIGGRPSDLASILFLHPEIMALAPKIPMPANAVDSRNLLRFIPLFFFSMGYIFLFYVFINFANHPEPNIDAI